MSLLLVLALTATWFAFTTEIGGSGAEASHFRSTQLTWQIVEKHADGRVDVEFSSTFAARRGYGSYGNPDVGDTVTEPTIRFGDGATIRPGHEVTSVDATNDWFIAEWRGVHTYDEAGQYTAYWSLCCRLGSNNGHVNNPDANNRIEAFLDLDKATSGPVSTISPIVDCPTEGLCQFQVPAFDAQGMSLSWRMATGSEATGSSFTQPAGDAPAAIDGGTGLYTWNTTGATLASNHPPSYYSTQIIVEKRNADGDLVASSGVDFFIRLGVSDDNAPPVFVAPTPSDGSTLYGAAGAELTFDVAADDPDLDDVVSLTMIGKPAAATFTTSSGNPASGSFSWTPSATTTRFVVLNAQDDSGLGATQRTVTLSIGDIASIDLAPSSADVAVGASHEVTATVLDGAGGAVEDVEVSFEVVDGPNAGQAGTATTDGGGQATHAYTSALAGTDQIVASVIDAASGHTLSAEPVSVTWIPEPGTLHLAPGSAAAALGDEHAVTAALTDDDGTPLADAEITFEVTVGPHAGTVGAATTNATGEATFAYVGDTVGTDRIVATHSPGAGDSLTSNTVTVDWTQVLAEAEEAQESDAADQGSGDDGTEGTDEDGTDRSDDDVEAIEEADAADAVEAQPDFAG